MSTANAQVVCGHTQNVVQEYRRPHFHIQPHSFDDDDGGVTNLPKKRGGVTYRVNDRIAPFTYTLRALI